MTTTIRSSADGSKSYIQVGGTDVVTLGTQGIEAGSFKPGAIVSNDLADGALIENSVNGIGYGVGAGGTVTQATSKSTAVTLNKPCGVITTNTSSLAGNSAVIFKFNNSLITNIDILHITAADTNVYDVRCIGVVNGYAFVRIVNLTAGALSDAIPLVFSLIKGAAS